MPRTKPKRQPTSTYNIEAITAGNQIILKFPEERKNVKKDVNSGDARYNCMNRLITCFQNFIQKSSLL